MALNGLIAANNLSDVVDIERTWDNIGSNISATVSVPSPTLDLNFAANKSLVDDVSGNNLITFSRASTGTFVGSNGLIQTAASGVPRFDHNPATGESLGLLVEEARTNLTLYSGDFSQAYWTKVSLSIFTANTIIAPDGTLTGSFVAFQNATSPLTSAQGLQASTTLAAGTNTLSCFAKMGTARYLALGLTNNSGETSTAVFDLQTGTVSGAASHPSFTVNGTSMVSAGAGWYRCSLTSTYVAGMAIHISSSTSGLSGVYGRNVSGNGTSGIYVWGAQIEASASFPTSYIPTTTATVTRAADVASITGTNFSSWYRQDEGTLYAKALNKNTAGIYIASINDSSILNQSLTIYQSSSSQTALFSRTSSGVQAQITVTGAINAFNKFAGCYKTNDFAVSVNSGTVGADTSGAIPISTTFDIGAQRLGAANGMSGTISRLTYYPVRLSNITLQALTTYGPVSSFPYSFSIKGRDILALKEVNKTSTRDFVFIKGLSSKAQPRITTASQYTASGVALRNAAMLKVAPTTAGNYFFSSGLTVSGVSCQINGTNALSIATSPFSSATATAPLFFAGLHPQANWRFSEAMTSGTVVFPEFAIPIETSDFLLFIKTGQS